MSRQERAEILSSISQVESSGALAYVTGDRPGMETQINSDQIPLFQRHIQSVGKVPKISVILYTRGGDTNTPWPLITALREHCEFLQVLIPYCANSSGTLFSLGADEIVMGPFSNLSPIDPTVVNGFNPMDPNGSGNRTPIAVEDVLAYLELAKGSVHGRSSRSKAFEALANQVHPLALGNVRRSISQIRILAKKLIELHSPDMSKRKMSAMVESLTTEFYTHSHLIGRQEARNLGLKVVNANPDQLLLMNRYYDQLKIDLQLISPWNAPLELKKAGGVITPLISNERAYIETPTTCDAFITTLKLQSKQIPTPTGPQNGIESQIDWEGWSVVD